MSSEGDLRARLEALVEEARAAGELDALSADWAELTSGGPAAPAATPQQLPGRFGLIGESPPMQELFSLIERVAPASVSVLIHGETGTGKELVARALHEQSPRRAKPFLAENCAAISPNLLESELFGHKRGAYTGAHADRDGHFVVADGGTVFLDEIGDMPLEMQAKLLRVLQSGEVRPVGSNKTRKVDVRVVAATNKDLAAMCRERAFREDLYFRLNVVTLELPPLRERGGDIELLARFILARASEGIGCEGAGQPLDLSPEATACLRAWSWPGNVRELENEIQRAAVFAHGTVQPADLSPQVAAAG